MSRAVQQDVKADERGDAPQHDGIHRAGAYGTAEEIEIAVHAVADFLRIQRELEQISRTVEALQLWAEKMMADGRIDRAAYTREISAAGEK